MAHLICEKCGGYYELGDEESLDDFDTCQCGGKLGYAGETYQNRYTEEIPQNDSEIHQNKEKKDKPKFICSNCMKENEEGIFCSKCGGKLIAVKNGKAININNFEESRELERLSYSSSKKYGVTNNPKGSKGLLDSINWLGVFGGVGFLVISIFLSVLLLAFSLFSSKSYSGYSGFVFTVIILVLLSCFLAIAAGSLTAFISKNRDYENGIINGFLVGLISSVILGIFVGLSAIFEGAIFLGGLTAFGGLIGVFIRKQLDK